MCSMCGFVYSISSQNCSQAEITLGCILIKQQSKTTPLPEYASTKGNGEGLPEPLKVFS